MKLPQGLQPQPPHAGCKVNKSFYRLKQASRQWYAKLIEVLYARGYQHSANDYYLFHKKTAHSHIFLKVYVDDILVTGNDIEEIQSLKSYLDHTFKIKDLGEAHFFLGIEILPTKDDLVLTLRKFAKDLLEEFGDIHHQSSAPSIAITNCQQMQVNYLKI